MECRSKGGNSRKRRRVWDAETDDEERERGAHSMESFN